MMKVTALFGHPTNPDEFDKQWADRHTPLVAKLKDVARFEFTKFVAAPDRGKPAFYYMSEAYFTTLAQMEQALATAEGQALVAEIANFATGGVTVMIGYVEA